MMMHVDKTFSPSSKKNSFLEILPFRKVIYSILLSTFFITNSHLLISKAIAKEEKLFICNNERFANSFWKYIRDNTYLRATYSQTEIDALYIKYIIYKTKENEFRKEDNEQCQWITGENLKVSFVGPSLAFAITNGKSDILFHNPASFGWINPNFYSYFRRSP